MTEPDYTCAATTSCTREPAVGLICQGHHARLGQTLADLETESAILSAVPSMQVSSGRPGGLASHRSPARIDVLVHTDRRRGIPGMSDASRTDPVAYDDTPSILDTLHTWARVVREERGFTGQHAATVSGERDTLARSLDWIAAQPWIDEFYRDIHDLMAALRSANGHRPDRPLSRCPAIVGGHYCAGQVWLHDELQPVWRRYTDRCSRDWEQAPGAAVCDTCGSSWVTPADKARLQRMVADAARELSRPHTDDGRPMLTAQELVERAIVSSVSNVRVIAHRLGKSSVDGHYDPAWFAERMTG